MLVALAVGAAVLPVSGCIVQPSYSCTDAGARELVQAGAFVEEYVGVPFEGLSTYDCEDAGLQVGLVYDYTGKMTATSLRGVGCIEVRTGELYACKSGEVNFLVRGEVPVGGPRSAELRIFQLELASDSPA
ncbi:MAG: hypothetical protein QM713_16100 [Arachnia sp.]